MKKGFTLIEILITITIFSIVITAFLGLFGSVFKYQRQSLSSAYLLNNASYITEYMSRALRMAKKELNDSPVCLSSRGLNYEIMSGGKSIKFINYDINNNKKCKEFFLDGTALKIEKDGVALPLTPTKLEVENLRFSVSGAEQPPTDNLQPKVTFILKLKTTEQSPQILNLQSTVSQRDLDIQY